MSSSASSLLFAACLASIASPVLAAPDEAPSAVTLDTVVVTVQKRPETEKNVPVAMTVIENESLERLRIRDLSDVGALAPSTVLSQSSGVNTLTVRGVGGGGRNIGFDPRVGVYLDGVYIGQAQALTMPWLDLQQAVFLRGPQGHLFGRNTVAGAVVLTSEPAQEPTQATVRATVGNDGRLEGQAMVAGAWSEDWAGRLAVSNEHTDGDIRNRYDGQRWGGLDRRGARAQVRWTPGPWQIDWSGDVSDSHQKVPYGQPITDFFDTPLPAGPLSPRVVSFNTIPYVDLRTWGTSLNAQRSLDNGGTLTALASVRDTRQKRQNDTDYSAADLLRVNYTDAYRQNSQEVRWASPDQGRVRGVVGFYGAQERANTNRGVTIGNDVGTLVPVPGLPIRLPFGAAFRLRPGFGAASVASVDTDSWAVFGNVDVDLSDRWVASVGGRYTEEEKSLRMDLNGAGSGALAIATLGTTDNRRDKDFSPRASVTFKVNDRVNAYLTYATGFKSGGWNVDFLNLGQAATGFGFAPETVTSWETGVKGSSANGKWSFEGSVFQADYDDYQVFQFQSLGGGAAVLQLRNAAKVRSRGAEISANWHPSSAWAFGAQVGALDARFVRFPNGGGAGVDLDGNRLPEAPKWTVGLQASYQQSLSKGYLVWQAEHHYRSSSFASANNAPVYDELSSRHWTNARVTFESQDGQWAVSLWSKNLFDRSGIDVRGRDFFGNQVVQYAQPRQVGVDVTWKY